MAVVGTSRRRLGNQSQSDDEFREHRDHHHRRHSSTSRPPNPATLAQSRAVLEALSDESSKLSRFLFVGKAGGDDRSDVDVDVDVDDDEGNREMRSMGDLEAALLALTLEPMHVRNERVVQIFEAFAIFGALFMNAVWIIYEWGSSKGGYGGEDVHPTVSRVFECVMALALTLNTFFALFAATFWILSLMWNSSHEKYAFLSRMPVVYLTTLIAFIPALMVVGLLLGIYSNLSPFLPEVVVASVVSLGVWATGMMYSTEFQLGCAPLECFHAPVWFKSVIYPRLSCSRKMRVDLKAQARIRAKELRKRAYQQRKVVDAAARLRRSGAPADATGSSLGVLLRRAAMNLGRTKYDVQLYENRLEEAWIDEPEQLREASVDFLTRYMPFGLAHEMHRLLEELYGENDT